MFPERPSTTESTSWLEDPRRTSVAELRGVKRGAAVVLRNVYWGHTHGWANLLEEHDLNPVVRIPRGFRKWMWRRSNAVEPGQAQAVLLFGAQRSGTNMVTYGLAQAPEFEVYNEGARRAFDNYRLRDMERISALMERSRHQFVLFKPLLDSHLAVRLLDDPEWSRPPRAIWVYRDVRARARSAVAKFGDSNVRVLRQRAVSKAFRHWQLGDSQSPSRESERILDSFDPFELSPLDGAALFWLTRNRLFFELELHTRENVRLVSYERFLADPERTMRGLCDFLELPYRPSLVAHVEPRPPAPGDVTGISPRILEMCDDLSLLLSQALH
jgi:hypothetical protein